jgi:hypothetical protein
MQRILRRSSDRSVPSLCFASEPLRCLWLFLILWLPLASGPPCRIDVTVGGVGDMRSKYGGFAYDPASLTDPTVRAAYVGEYLPTWLGYFEKLLQRAGGQYFGGSVFSFADIMVFDIIDHNLRVEPSCLAKFPTLQQCASRSTPGGTTAPPLRTNWRCAVLCVRACLVVGAIGHKPGVWEYVSDPSRRRGYANGANAAYDTPNHSPPGNGFAPPPKETQKAEL